MNRSRRGHHAAAAGVAVSAKADSGGEMLRVIVIEDEPDVAALYGDVLGEAGYAVTFFSSALGARASMQRERPAAVVLDLGLPYRSGLALLSDLKADPATAAIPVVVVSGLTADLPAEALPLVAARLSKPFDFDKLVATLRGVISAVSQS